MRKFPLVIFLALTLISQSADIGFGAEQPGSTPLSWLDGLTLIVLENDDISTMHQARVLIQQHGGRIALMSPPRVMLGWIPFELREELVGRAGIEDIFFTEVLPEETGIEDEQNRRMLAYFNAAVRGDLQTKYELRRALAPARDDTALRVSDMLDPPLFQEREYLENLRAAGLDPALLKDRGLLLEKSGQVAAGNTDQMTGTVAVTVFFVESDGSGADPDQHTWTEAAMQEYINGVNNGLAWWTEQSYSHTGCWVAFMVRFHSATDSRCQQWYEPVKHPSTDQIYWVGLVMDNFGYTIGTTTTKVNSYNTWQRAEYGADRAYSAFVAYNPSPASDRFTNGYAAAAYWGGPYTYLLYRSFDWEVEEVFTHETGHIFHACDEYYQAGYGGCSGCGVCYNDVINGNCQKDGCGPGKSCMMMSNTFSLCQYTPGHLGWFESPCAPPPLSAPTVSSSAPAGQYQGFDEIVTVTGTNFLWGTFIDLGPDIIINSMTFVSAETIQADITILNAAEPGLRNIVVYNRDLQSAILPGAFRVKKTTRHYMSSSGGNVYPYISPADAATSLTEAIAVANDGDSLYVATTTFSGVSVLIDHGVSLFGGWNSDFSARDLTLSKTVFDLHGNVTISAGTSTAGLDGFIIENGEGVYQTVPFQATYGGGVRILSGTVRIANCEIRDNNAGVGEFDVGIGGAIFAMNSDVTIDGNTIENNNAERGGGVYLYNCSGTVRNNTISANQLGAPNPNSARGGGVYLQEASGVTIANNTITGNGGAYNGGGIYIDLSSAVFIADGVISHHSVAWEGAGVYVGGSEVTIEGVSFLRNTAVVFGGGIAVEGASTIIASGNRFLWNAGVVGGSVYANGTEGFLNHNLFVGSSGSNGGALYLNALTGGSLIGNTIDRTDAAGTGGAVQILGADLPVFNNIITNSNGYGIHYNAAPLQQPRYNDIWNNSTGDRYGCSPGTGSISVDPLYADTVQTDYHLIVHSPAIDAGDTTAAYTDPDGSRGDMGVYGSHFFAMNQPSYPKNLQQAVQGGNAVISWNRNPEGDVQFYAVYRDTVENFTPTQDNFVQFVAAEDTSYIEPFSNGAYYRISAVDTSSYGSGYSRGVRPTATAVGGSGPVFRFILEQNVPNPFNPSTTIRYQIDRSGPVSLAIYDVQGRLVKRLVNARREAGSYHEVWNGTNQAGAVVSSGVYFYKLRAGGSVQTRKMVLLK